MLIRGLCSGLLSPPLIYSLSRFEAMDQSEEKFFASSYSHPEKKPSFGLYLNWSGFGELCSAIQLAFYQHYSVLGDSLVEMKVELAFSRQLSVCRL
jgi:hypothetical protein